MRFSYFFVPTVLVLLIPILFILNGYHWTLNDLGSHSGWLWVAFTGNKIPGIIISLVLVGVVAYFYRKNPTLAITLGLYCLAVLGASFIIKDYVKNKVQEERPFVIAMAQDIAYGDKPLYFVNLENAYESLGAFGLTGNKAAGGDKTTTPGTSDSPDASKNGQAPQPATPDSKPIPVPDQQKDDNSADNDAQADAPLPPDSFDPAHPFNCRVCKGDPNAIRELYYKLNKEQRTFFVNNFIATFFSNATDAQKQELLKMSKKTSYSLPSGHYVLGSLWIMIFMVLAFNVRKWSFWAITGGVTVWGLSLGISRVLTGYHFAHDILFSAIIESALVWCTFWLVLVGYKVLYFILNQKLKVFPLHEDPTMEVPVMVKPKKAQTDKTA